MGPPIRREGDHFAVELPEPTAALVTGLCGELETLLREGSPLTERLFPPPYGDDAERNEGYSVLAGAELVENRLEAVATVRKVLQERRADEEELSAWMRSLNDMRLVLGTMMDVTDDDDPADVRIEHRGAYRVYEVLGGMLEMTVMALTEDLEDPGAGTEGED